MNDLITKIVDWANARNLIKGSDYNTQLLKLLSEVGELADGIAKNDVAAIKDAIGDCYVVLVILSNLWADHDISKPIGELGNINPTKAVFHLVSMLSRFGHVELSQFNLMFFVDYLNALAIYYDLTLAACVQAAYDEIKHRKGVMHNGVFVKESDPLYKELVND